MACNPADIKSKQLTIRWSDGTGGNPADDGTRPLPSNTAYYLSPDLYLTGGLGSSTAEVGVANTVHARIFNFGDSAATNVNVEVWVCNFTLGVNPASSLASSNPGGAPMTGFVASLNAGASQDIQVTPTWTPVDADAALNGGHVCMAGNCYADGEGASFSGTDMKFLCDCHHGQRNIAVVKVMMSQIRNFRFRLYVANPLEERQIDAVVAIRPVEVKPEFAGNLNQLLTESPHVEANPNTGALHLVESLGGHAIQWARALPTLVGMAHPVGTVGTDAPLKLGLRPRQHEVVETNLQFQPTDRPGTTHVFDLTEHSGDELVGGARLITVLTP
jgi:hypothetical protein